MRLINIHTMVMEQFIANPPPYAILSHRWIGREITYEEYQDPQKRTGPGYQKIVDFCRTVRKDETLLALVDDLDRHQWCGQIYGRCDRCPGCSNDVPRLTIDWIWVDTCCIDKRSSAELSESINSMWEWYCDAALCVVYLFDVREKSRICDSEWFTRGWTLQELLAPENTLFYNQQWDILGWKSPKYRRGHLIRNKPENDLSAHLSRASGIPERYLSRGNTDFDAQPSIAQRMSWASRRRTTRKEDAAYCLFGLFEVNLPLLYGEGDRAFLRLQQEIARRSEDDSIFAWTRVHQTIGSTGLFAPSSMWFEDSGNIIALPSRGRSFQITEEGVDVNAPLAKFPDEYALPIDYYLLLLNCAKPDIGHAGFFNQCLLVLEKMEQGVFQRVHTKRIPVTFLQEIQQALESDGTVKFMQTKVRVPERAAMREMFVHTRRRVNVRGYKMLYSDYHPLGRPKEIAPLSRPTTSNPKARQQAASSCNSPLGSLADASKLSCRTPDDASSGLEEPSH